MLDPALDAIIGVSAALKIMEDIAAISEQEGLPTIKDALSAQDLENEMHPESS